MQAQPCRRVALQTLELAGNGWALANKEGGKGFKQVVGSEKMEGKAVGRCKEGAQGIAGGIGWGLRHRGREVQVSRKLAQAQCGSSTSSAASEAQSDLARTACLCANMMRHS